jgi:serine/threonine protein phosphatase PrpC
VILKLTISLFEEAHEQALLQTDVVHLDSFDSTLITCIKHSLSQLKKHLNDKIIATDADLAAENGATLALVVLVPTLGASGTLFGASIGDSTLILCSESSIPLPVWKRDEDDEFAVCNFEDTLASYPDAIKQGQTMEAVKRDHEQVASHCRCMANARGLRYYAVQSTRSPYGLSMINTLGNMNHAGRCLDRTNVYAVDLDKVFLEARNHEVTLVMCTDGVKDVLSAEDIASLTPDVSKGLQYLAGGPGDDVFDEIVKNRGLGSLVPQTDAFRQRLQTRDLPSRDRYDRSARKRLRIVQETPTSLASFCDAIVNLSILRKSGDDVTAVALKLNKTILRSFREVKATQTLSQVSSHVQELPFDEDADQQDAVASSQEEVLLDFMPRIEAQRDETPIMSSSLPEGILAPHNSQASDFDVTRTPPNTQATESSESSEFYQHESPLSQPSSGEKRGGDVEPKSRKRQRLD